MTSLHDKRHSGHPESGFTLIEILVALFVFAIGILSIAGLQVMTKHANNEAVQRTTASMLAFEMVERIRVNRNLLDPVSTLAARAIYASVAAEGLPPGVVSSPNPDCLSIANSCTSAQMAMHDLWMWQQSINGASETVVDPETAVVRATGGLEDPTGCITGPWVSNGAGGLTLGAAGGVGIYRVAIAWRGATELANPIIDACGEDRGVYGTGNVYRRILVVNAFIE